MTISDRVEKLTDTLKMKILEKASPFGEQSLRESKLVHELVALER